MALYEKNSIETIDEKGAASVSAPFARSASILGRGIIGRYLHLLYAEEPHAAHYRRALCLIMRGARALPFIKLHVYVMINVVTKKALFSLIVMRVCETLV